MTTKVTIGTDPELIFSKNGEIVRAADLIRKRDSKFGVDGHPFTAELRPDCAVLPRDLVENLRKLLKTEAERLKAYEWFAGPWVFGKPLGGHLHFGVSYRDEFKDALDNQLGIILALIEPEAEARTRRTTTFPGARDQRPYGLLGDVRRKAWGFEYRTPGSFIVSPGVSLGLITVAKAIIMEELEDGPNAWRNQPTRIRNELEFAPEDFYNLKRNVFLSRLEPLWNILKLMKYFKEGEEGHDLWSAVNYLKAQVISRNGFSLERDIKSRWRLLAVAPEHKKEKSPKLRKPLSLVNSKRTNNGFWEEGERVIEDPPRNTATITAETLWQYSDPNGSGTFYDLNYIIQNQTGIAPRPTIPNLRVNTVAPTPFRLFQTNGDPIEIEAPIVRTGQQVTTQWIDFGEGRDE